MNVGNGHRLFCRQGGQRSRPSGHLPKCGQNPGRARCSINAADGDIILDLPGDGTWLVGDRAISQSPFVDRREDRGWIRSDAYYRLVMAGFTELTSATSVDLVVVTGLPVAFYSKDKNTLRDLLPGQHRATRAGRRGQLLKVTDCRASPQPFGCLLAEIGRGRQV
jgi:hypothetical protein